MQLSCKAMRMKRLDRSPIFISGAAAITALGFEWRGLGKALTEGTARFSNAAHQDAYPKLIASEVPSIPASMEAGNAKIQKLMSRAAHLGAIAVQCALSDAGWNNDRENIGFYFGVGASGGSMAELTHMLHASIVEKQFSLPDFGSAGLAACNPLFAFQLMNNFTLCHGAILSGIGGPNSAFYSRGNGTVAALFEAAHAISEGDCEQALAGGADSALHAVTWAEIKREGYAKDGFIAGEGAALLALSSRDTHAIAILEHCMFQNILTLINGQCELIDSLLLALDCASIDCIIIAPWGTPARQPLRTLADTYFKHTTVFDLSKCLGEALAATPTIAWVAALDLLHTGIAKRCLILNAGIDGGIGAVLMKSCPQ